MSTGSSSAKNHLFVDDVLRRAGVDLWGAAANEPARPLAPASAHRDLAHRAHRPAALARLEHGDAAAYRAEYRRLNGLLDAAGAALVAALRRARPRGRRGRRDHLQRAARVGRLAGRRRLRPQDGGHPGRPGLDRQDRRSSCRPRPAPRCASPPCSPTCAARLGAPVTEGRCGGCRRCLDACPAARRTRRRLAGRHGPRPAVRRRRLPATWTRSSCGRPHLWPLRRRLPVRPAARHRRAASDPEAP